MTFFEQLDAHHGGLIRLKTQLCWYGSGRYDGVEGRICILLDPDSVPGPHQDPFGPAWRHDAFTQMLDTAEYHPESDRVSVILLIDGSPKWVMVSEETVEFIQ